MEISLLKLIVSFAVLGVSIFMILAARDVTKPDKLWRGKKEELIPCKNCDRKFVLRLTSKKQYCPHCSQLTNPN
jgi:Zn finger protein HypA/HybF involved in hydrogenase expression